LEILSKSPLVWEQFTQPYLLTRFLTHLFFYITKPWCSIVIFDTRYSTFYADPGHKMREHFPAASVVLSTQGSPLQLFPTLLDFGNQMGTGMTIMWQDAVHRNFRLAIRGTYLAYWRTTLKKALQKAD
jgi:hypothetical protein